MQAYGLVILNHLDAIERENASQESLKRSLVANGHFDHRKLFPEYFPAEPDDAETAEAGSDADNPDADLDYSEVRWLAPSEDQDEFERLMGALNRGSSGVKSGDQVAEPTWTEWV